MTAAKNSKLALAFILITVLIDIIGLGIIIPVLPHLIEELTGGTIAEAAVFGGFLLFVYALMQFIFSPILGNLSDRFGRRPVLLLSLLGLTLDYILMGFAPTIAWLFVGRVLSGIMGAAVSTATAYIADISTPRKKSAKLWTDWRRLWRGLYYWTSYRWSAGRIWPTRTLLCRRGLGVCQSDLWLFRLAGKPDHAQTAPL